MRGERIALAWHTPLIVNCKDKAKVKHKAEHKHKQRQRQSVNIRGMTQTHTFTHPWLSIELLTCETLLLLLPPPPLTSVSDIFVSFFWMMRRVMRVCLLRRILVYTVGWKWKVGGFDPWHPVSEAREEDSRDSEQSKMGLCNHMHNSDSNMSKVHKHRNTNTVIVERGFCNSQKWLHLLMLEIDKLIFAYHDPQLWFLDVYDYMHVNTTGLTYHAFTHQWFYSFVSELNWCPSWPLSVFYWGEDTEVWLAVWHVVNTSLLQLGGKSPPVGG